MAVDLTSCLKTMTISCLPSREVREGWFTCKVLRQNHVFSFVMI